MLDRTLLIVAPRLEGSYIDERPLPKPTRYSRPRARKRHKAKQPRGMWNSGQSCHLSAIITALSALPALRHWISNQPPLHNAPIVPLTHSILQAACGTEEHNVAIDPRPTLSLLERDGWKSRFAQDAHETLLRVLELVEDHVEEPRQALVQTQSVGCLVRDERQLTHCIGRTKVVMEWKRERKPPYTSTTASWSHCFQCGYTTPLVLTDSPMMVVSATAEREKPLASLISHTMFSKTQVHMRCEGCGENCAHLHCSEVWRFPKVLITLVQRGMYGARGVSISRAKVWFNDSISIYGPYGRGQRRRELRYGLRSVVRHVGGASGYKSHYDCIVRCPEATGWGLCGVDSKPKWWRVDDARVMASCMRQACESSHVYLTLFELEDDVYKTH
ncbi:hypothetical protein BWQ96_03817 [Gracilariopsis chorda]|uniref:ubiquitinyl hydrolase 1 n=1 Tax=Gracilariopsis chorda TaxID=448386 RepID=A0A2V3IWG9_9FLOR|nr:hypothetical protein BWQ96_03817 [Gracilariopsis chorda]|eukprot:PXF46423.1 hypothetical protein BWQ96_03817 [Gracilariopsis chorda]